MVVAVMNDIMRKPGDELFQYQAGRLKDLIDGIAACRQMQTSFLSQKFRIPLAEIRCLLLFRGERYMTVKGIASRLGVAKSRVTKVIGGLLSRGLIDYADDPRDRRVKLISLTPRGLRECEQMGNYIWSSYEKLLAELEPDERRNVIASLESLRAGMEACKSEYVESDCV